MNKLHLVGLAVVTMGVTANGASAQDRTITTATTSPISTSDPDPANPPVQQGNITVGNGGSITVPLNQTAVTVNTDNDVTVATGGTISSNNANGTTGIFVTGGRNSDLTNSGTISLVEDYTLTDTDNDGDFDGGFATGSTRFGIWVDSGGLTGNIANNATITIEGNSSAAIRVDGAVTGDITSSGVVNVNGDNSSAFLIQGGALLGINGDVLIRGGANVRGTNSTGLTLNAPIINGGELRLNGTWTTSGFHSTTRPADVTHLDADDLQNGGSAAAIHYSVLGGVTIEGIGVEDDPDDDGDGTSNETDDNLAATLRTFGSSPTVWIAGDPSANLILGANGDGYGFQNRGTIIADGVYDGFSATALRIEGLGGSTVSAGDVTNDRSMTAIGHENEAYAMFIGANANLTSLQNRGSMLSSSVSETAQNGYGVFIDALASVPILTNTGDLRAQLFGEIGGATAILDNSGTLTQIDNSGTIAAIVVATDADLTDNVVPVATGPAVAIDVSSALSGVTLNQTAATVFTDDDLVDNDATTLPAVSIQGDILLGNFGDTINLLAGEILGDIDFAGGVDAMTINNGALFRGQLSDDGSLQLNVIDGTLDLRGGNVSIDSATFGADGVLGVLLSDVPAESTLITANSVTFAPGSRIVAEVPTGLPVSDSITFLTATTLNGASNVTGAISGPGTSYLYNLAIVLGTPTSLQLDFQIKTPTQLGMSANQGAAFDPILEALRQDDAAADAFAALDNQFDFFDAYEDLMPSFSSAATELATTAIQQMQSATTNRLSATRLHDLNDVSVWAQEIAYGLSRDPSTFQGQEYRGHGFGLATGIDGPLQNGGLFGLSASFLTSEVEEPGRPQGEISTTFGQANAYYGTAMGPIDLDFVGGVGAGQMSERRFVEIGDSFSALTEADWWSFEGHGAVRASAPMRLAEWMIITPQTALTYVYLNEQGYEESGGGAAIDYEADSASSQRLWGDIGVEFSGRLHMGARTIVAPRLYAGWRANLINEEAERTFHVISTGDEFTLTDEDLGDGGALVGLGIDASNGYSTFTLGYEGEFGDQVERHSLNASVRFRF